MTEIRKYDRVRVINLKITDRPYVGTAGFMRPPRIGDIGTVVRGYEPEDLTAPLIVENKDENGATLWLADFERDELEVVYWWARPEVVYWGRPVEYSAEFIAQYIERLRKEGGPLEGCSPLEELDPQVLQPYAISEQDEDVRAYLVEVIWEHRRPDSAPFLARMLNDPSKKVWKVALDGLVLLGLPVVEGGLGIDAALVALKAARAGASAKQVEDIDEAIDHIEHPEAWMDIK
jgi:hypothetical protein